MEKREQEVNRESSGWAGAYVRWSQTPRIEPFSSEVRSRENATKAEEVLWRAISRRRRHV